MSTATLPGAEIEASVKFITEQRESLENAYQASTAALEAREDELKRAEGDLRRKIAVHQKANAQLFSVNREYEATDLRAVIHAMDDPNLDLSAFDKLISLDQKRKALGSVIERLTLFFLPEAKELILVFRSAVADAEADQLEAIVAQNRFEIEVAIAPLTAIEGEVVLNRDFGVTADLGRRAAEARLRAEYIRKDLLEMQRAHGGKG